LCVKKLAKSEEMDRHIARKRKGTATESPHSHAVWFILFCGGPIYWPPADIKTTD